MSIHDETWDRCFKCKRVIKSWHGDYHDSGGCLLYENYIDWKDRWIQIKSITPYLDGGTIQYIFNDGMIIYEDHRLMTKTEGRYFFEYPSDNQKPIEKLSEKYEKLIKNYYEKG